MSVCLVRCPSPFLIDDRMFPPLGLLAVGAGLRQKGFDVTVYDGELKDLPLDFDGYGFGPTTPEYPVARDYMRIIKGHNPWARVVLGGAHATLNPSPCVDDGWDCVVMGDGEVEAARAFTEDLPVVIAHERPLDEYPMPDRSLINPRSYHCTLEDKPATPVVGSRGCPFRCGFCCKNYTTVRLHSAARMCEEIDYLRRDFGYEALTFPEDIFILDRERTEAVCLHLWTHGIVWRCLVRADLVVKYGPDFLRMLRDCGCVGVGMGIESGSDKILRTIRKGETARTMMRAVRMLKRAGIFTRGFFVLGLPGEDEESLAETERFLVEADLDDIDCKIFQPYPGSPIHDNREQYDVDWPDVPPEHAFYKGLPGLYNGGLRTSSLTTERLVEAWMHLEATYKRWDEVPGVLVANEA